MVVEEDGSGIRTFGTAGGHAVGSFALLLAGGADHGSERPAAEERLIYPSLESGPFGEFGQYLRCFADDDGGLNGRSHGEDEDAKDAAVGLK